MILAFLNCDRSVSGVHLRSQKGRLCALVEPGTNYKLCFSCLNSNFRRDRHCCGCRPFYLERHQERGGLSGFRGIFTSTTRYLVYSDFWASLETYCSFFSAPPISAACTRVMLLWFFCEEEPADSSVPRSAVTRIIRMELAVCHHHMCPCMPTILFIGNNKYSSSEELAFYV